MKWQNVSLSTQLTVHNPSHMGLQLRQHIRNEGTEQNMASYQCHHTFAYWCQQLALVWSSASCLAYPVSSSVRLPQGPLLGNFRNMQTMNSEVQQVHFRIYSKKITKRLLLLEDQACLQPMNCLHSLDSLQQTLSAPKTTGYTSKENSLTPANTTQIQPSPPTTPPPQESIGPASQQNR